MPYVIAAPCVADYSCVEACPVDCIGPRPDDPGFDEAEQLYIDPSVCINCEACLIACPVSAVYPDFDIPTKWSEYPKINADYYAKAAS